ncbi:hypothetical protein [Erysipelothrix larvae]|uniref:hypothetical protein n=1 Tax=Erysipelothrix larvae TaxID=1514105 RepID=UPI000B058C3D|nr:hypothetical protein [Erysipelothrix larvae]
MEEIENNFTYENGVFLINEEEIIHLIDNFDFTSMNKEFGTDYNKDSFRKKLLN